MKRLRTSLLPLLTGLCIGSAVNAKPTFNPKIISYKEDTTVLEGHFFLPKNQGKKSTAAFLLFPDWMGMSPVADQYAEKWAKEGFAVFVADIYGKGVSPKSNEEAGKWAALYKNNRPLMRARAKAALHALSQLKEIDSSKIASIGYCFGGTCALELARSGAPVLATISLHGGLDTPTPDDAKQIQGKILVLHGGDDPYVPAEQVGNFIQEMRAAKVDWQLVEYGGAVHGFSNPMAPLDASQGYAYNPEAEKRSTLAIKLFSQEVFHPLKGTDLDHKKP